MAIKRGYVLALLIGLVIILVAAACGGEAATPTPTPRPPTPTPTHLAPTPTRTPSAATPTSTPRPATPTPTTAPTGGDAANGKALYAAKGCNACHGANAEGAPGLGPKLAGLYGGTETLADDTKVAVDDAYLTESIKSPVAKVVKGFQPIMPPIPLTDAEIKDLIAYIAGLK